MTRSACHQVFSRSLLPDADSSLTGFRPVDCRLLLRVDDAFSGRPLAQPADLLGKQTCYSRLSPSRRLGIGPRVFFFGKVARRSTGLALGSDQRRWRQSDKLHMASSPPRTMAHNSYSRRCRFRHRQFSSLAEHVHVATKHNSAVLVNKDTFARDFTRTGRPTRRAPTSRSPTSTLTTSAPGGGPSALRCCCSSTICAWSLVLSS